MRRFRTVGRRRFGRRQGRARGAMRKSSAPVCFVDQIESAGVQECDLTRRVQAAPQPLLEGARRRQGESQISLGVDQDLRLSSAR